MFFNQDQEHRGQLKEGRRLSPYGGLYSIRPIFQEKYARSEQNQNIPDDDKDCEPYGNNVHGGKADKRGGQKAFVRQRVKIGPQAALLIEKSRHQAVGGIAQSGQNKNHETGQKAVVDDENQENRHQEYSEDTDQIRNGHRKGLFKVEKDIVSIGLAQV